MHETQMLREIREIPVVVERQVREGAALYREAGERLRRKPPRFIISGARGSSAQAVVYFKYLVETRLGLPVAAIGPSVASVYDAPLKLENTLFLAVSQSGGSPDLAALQQKARAGGAEVLALLNVVDSPLGRGADQVLPLLAGSEKAVAATKSFVASMVAIASIVAAWSEDRALLQALQRLPDTLASTLLSDWSAAEVPFVAAHSAYAIGRGPGLAVAGEAALKLKETCRLHAECYSAAEVQHGPIALAGDRFAAVLFLNGDAADRSVLAAADRFRAARASIFTVGGAENELAAATAPSPVLQPICQIASFYRFAERLSARLGENPDAPTLLTKVTETV